MARKPRAPIAPDMPPLTVEEQALSLNLRRRMEELTAQLRQRNLDNAVLLAQQAARGQGPLVDWFSEIGRRFGDTLTIPPETPKLRAIDGGRS